MSETYDFTDYEAELAAVSATKPSMSGVKTDPESFRIPGQYEVNGMPLGAFTPKGHLGEIKTLDFEKSDILLASYPKTGTTLTQEITYLCRHDGDTDKANQTFNYIRTPYLDNAWPDHTNGLTLFKKTEHPRLLKTHLPFEYMPEQILSKGIRCIYVMRNPKDTLVSYYYFYKSTSSFGKFPGLWSDFFEMFLLNNLCYGNLIDNYLSWWEHRDKPNILFLFYEDLLRFPKREIKKIAAFCDRPDMPDATIDKITEATSFKNMKSNPKTNYTSIPEDIDCSVSAFMRKGLIGDWKNHFTIAQNEIMDKILKERLAGTGLDFVYEA
ncbi:sulfotransferase 1A1-like isoform X2 [Lineus longissimus]